MAPLTIHVQTYLDTSCPWCYIGKVILDRAIDTYRSQHPEVEFELSWHPFYLFPDAKVSAYDKNAYYALKFGPAGVPAFTARVEREAAALGLGRLSFAGRVGDTRDSHLLLLLAQGRGPSSLVAAKLQDALFRGEFHEGRDVSDRAFLLEAVRGVGMLGDDGDGEAGMLREAELVAWLDSEGARAMVDGMERRAKTEVGIVAVPSFVVQGRYRVGGKQEEGVFLELFERIRRAEVEDLGKAEIIESAEGLGEGERC